MFGCYEACRCWLWHDAWKRRWAQALKEAKVTKTYPAINPELPLGQVLEFVPVIEEVIAAVVALRGTALGQSHTLPVIKEVRIAGEKWDFALSLTRRG